jgi:hypothetical protein
LLTLTGARRNSVRPRLIVDRRHPRVIGRRRVLTVSRPHLRATGRIGAQLRRLANTQWIKNVGQEQLERKLYMKQLIVPSACLALLATTALAQTPSPPPAIGVTASTAWGQQADIQGTVKAFKMTPVGDLEGMILTDGTEVHVPPHLSSQLAAVVRPGEAVRVLGWRSSVPNFIVATSMTGQRGQSVVDQGPPHNASSATSRPTGAGCATRYGPRAGPAGPPRSSR